MSAANGPGVGGAAVLADKRYKRYKRYVLLLLAIAGTLNHLDRNVISILMEPIKYELGVSDVAMGALTGLSFAVLYSVFSLPIGWLADKANRKNILAASLFVWSGMTILCGMVTSYLALFIARTGVGIGEAGGIPTTTSLIGDYFKPRERGAANGWIAFGSTIGAVGGLALGGVVNHYFGWRWAFVAAGVPGLLLVPIIWYSLAEPQRGQQDGHSTPPPTVGIREAIRRLGGNASLLHLIAGGALANVGNAVILWLPAFYGRAFNLGTAEIGLWLTLVQGVSAAVGVLVAGWIADRLFVRDARWHAWLVAITTVACVPFLVAALLAPTLWLSFVILIPAIALKFAYHGPYIAVLQSLSGPQLRATAAALSLFAVNIIGLGLGPVMIGALSDLLAQRGGGLREALCLISPILFWSGYHFYLAARPPRQH